MLYIKCDFKEETIFGKTRLDILIMHTNYSALSYNLQRDTRKTILKILPLIL